MAPPAIGDIEVKYDLEWVNAVMLASTDSMVKFKALSLAFLPKDLKYDRRYPRSFHRPFTLGRDKDGPRSSTAASAGGRDASGSTGPIYGLCELLSQPFGGKKALLPISDIAILSKRAVCSAVRGALSSAPAKTAPKHVKATTRHLKVMGGGVLDLKTTWPVHEYPMLCMTGPDVKMPAFSEGTDHKDAYWRIVQCVFGAALTREIREKEIGIEVVSREGFGSVFPTLSNIPDGIRLDPGLLPPEKGSAAIVAALAVVNHFIDGFPGDEKPTWAPALAGMTAAALTNVDRLMAKLHAFTLGSTPGADYATFVSELSNLSTGDEKFTLPRLPLDVNVGYPLPGVGLIPGPTPDRRKFWSRVVRKGQTTSDALAAVTGYGSDSDYEDEPDRKSGGDPHVKIGSKAIKKITVVSGMAALRMAAYYAMAWTSRLSKATGSTDASPSPVSPSPASPSSALPSDAVFAAWAKYFELDLAELAKLAEAFEGNTVSVRVGAGQVLVFDGAPNPINIPTDPPPPIAVHSLGAIVIDTTNNTTQEKADYLDKLEAYLVEPSSEGLGGLMILVDSVSKHPTGGDLVHGVMRVYGPWKSVECFYQAYLLVDHLGLNKTGTVIDAVKKQTVLSADETGARRAMIASRLVMRNAELMRSLWALPKTIAKAP
jgi:hypothetical protein